MSRDPEILHNELLAQLKRIAEELETLNANFAGVTEVEGKISRWGGRAQMKLPPFIRTSQVRP